MTTKAEVIAELKKEYVTLRTGYEEHGYTNLNPAEYEATIEKWAENQLSDEAAKTKAAADKSALLAKLGITADEAKLLLS